MPKFSTHFPFIKSSRPGTTGATRGNTPAPDNPVSGNAASDNVAVQDITAPQVTPLPVVDVAPSASTEPQDAVEAPGNAAQGQDVSRPIAINVASLLGEPQTLEAMDASTPERGKPAAGNVAFRNVAMQDAGLQASTSVPVNVVQHTSDSLVNKIDTYEAVPKPRPVDREERAREVRPASAAQVEATMQINATEMKTGKGGYNQVDTALMSAEPPVPDHDSCKDVLKHQITQSKGWKLMRESLKAVKELSDAFMPLKATVSAILLVTDYVEMVQENDTKLCDYGSCSVTKGSVLSLGWDAWALRKEGGYCDSR